MPPQLISQNPGGNQTPPWPFGSTFVTTLLLVGMSKLTKQVIPDVTLAKRSDTRIELPWESLIVRPCDED